MSLRVAKQLEAKTGKQARVLDLCRLKPLNAELIAKHARECAKVLVVGEGRQTGGLAEQIFTVLDEQAPSVAKKRVAGKDSYIPLAAAANLVLMSEQDIYKATEDQLL